MVFFMRSEKRHIASTQVAIEKRCNPDTKRSRIGKLIVLTSPVLVSGLFAKPESRHKDG